MADIPAVVIHPVEVIIQEGAIQLVVEVPVVLSWVVAVLAVRLIILPTEMAAVGGREKLLLVIN